MADAERRDNQSEESGYMSKRTKTVLVTVLMVILVIVVIIIILVKAGWLTFRNSSGSDLSDSSRSGIGKARVKDSSKSKRNDLSGESTEQRNNDDDAKLYG